MSDHHHQLPHGHVQDGFQPLVQFHSADLLRPEGQLLGQRTDSGTDLQHTGSFIHTGLDRNGFRHPGGNQKVLSLSLGEMETVTLKQRFHHLNIAYIDHILSPQKSTFLPLS